VIGRLIRTEVAELRGSLVVWLAVLLVAGGSALARMLAWVSDALARTELHGLPFIPADTGWSDVAVPLALLAYLIMTSYVFGRDFEDGNIDLILTAPVRRESVVVARTIVIAIGVLVLSLAGWGADVALRTVLATSSFDPGSATTAGAALGSAIAAIVTLPLVAWASVRFRGVLPALGLGIAIEVVVLALGWIAVVRLLPWFLPTALASGGGAPWLSIALSVLLFAGGIAATFRGLRTVDLYE
jgi:ABC-2 type transport system permease protein